MLNKSVTKYKILLTFAIALVFYIKSNFKVQFLVIFWFFSFCSSYSQKLSNFQKHFSTYKGNRCIKDISNTIEIAYNYSINSEWLKIFMWRRLWLRWHFTYPSIKKHYWTFCTCVIDHINSTQKELFDW